MEKYGGALQFASTELKADHWVVLQAVKKSGNALAHASDELKADRGVVTVAVKQAGKALQYAPTALKADRGVVTEATKQDGGAFRWASAALKADLGLVLELLNTKSSSGFVALMYASASVHAELDFCGSCFEFDTCSCCVTCGGFEEGCSCNYDY